MGSFIIPFTMSTVRHLVTLFSLLSSVLSCPSGGDRVWVGLGDSCYSISQQAMDWGTAQEYCWYQGGYLAEITSTQEESLLDTFLMDGISYWLGLPDLAHEGTYRWQESHHVAEYTNWAPSEPTGRDDQDCVWKTFNHDHPGWHDAVCTLTYWEPGLGQVHALCE